MKCIYNKETCILNDSLRLFIYVGRTSPEYVFYLIVCSFISFWRVYFTAYIIQAVVNMIIQKSMSAFLYVLYLISIIVLSNSAFDIFSEYLGNTLYPKIREKIKYSMSEKMLHVPYYMLEDKKFIELKDKVTFVITNKGALYNLVFYCADFVKNFFMIFSAFIILVRLNYILFLLLAIIICIICKIYSGYMDFQKSFYDSFAINSKREDVYNDMLFDKQAALDIRSNNLQKK